MPRVEEFDKESVLQSAMNLFWEKGYHATSMQDLVDATELNRSSLYNSFGSKLELYQQSLNYYQRQTSGIFQKALVKAKDPLHAIRLIFESFLPEMLADDQEKGCFVLNCRTEMGNQESSIREWLLRAQENNLALFKELIIDGQEQGIINTKKTSEQYAYYILNAFQGFRMTGILVKDREVLDQIVKQTIEILK